MLRSKLSSKFTGREWATKPAPVTSKSPPKLGQEPVNTLSSIKLYIKPPPHPNPLRSGGQKLEVGGPEKRLKP